MIYSPLFPSNLPSLLVSRFYTALCVGARREELEILFRPSSSKLLFGIASSGTTRVTFRPQEALFCLYMYGYQFV